jgi:uncharacterized protein
MKFAQTLMVSSLVFLGGLGYSSKLSAEAGSEPTIIKRTVEYYLENKQEIFHGPYLESSDEKILIKGNYAHGQKTGLWETWHPNGMPASEQEFKNNLAEGLYREWSPSGNLISKVLYQQGQKLGLEEKWFENGKRYLYTQWENGLQNGPQQEWFENGQERLRCTYFNGLQDGLVQEWDESGNLKREDLYLKGIMRQILLASEKYLNGANKEVYPYYLNDKNEEVRHGQYSKWFPNGEIWITCEYVHGELHGLWQYGKLDGLQCRQETYRMGVKHGPFKWYQEGKLIREDIWRDGTLVTQTRF